MQVECAFVLTKKYCFRTIRYFKIYLFPPQVWFQNARAKEKRARSLSSDSAEREQAELSAGAGERDRA